MNIALEKEIRNIITQINSDGELKIKKIKKELDKEYDL